MRILISITLIELKEKCIVDLVNRKVKLLCDRQLKLLYRELKNMKFKQLDDGKKKRILWSHKDHYLESIIITEERYYTKKIRCITLHDLQYEQLYF